MLNLPRTTLLCWSRLRSSHQPPIPTHIYMFTAHTLSVLLAAESMGKEWYHSQAPIKDFTLDTTKLYAPSKRLLSPHTNNNHHKADKQSYHQYGALFYRQELHTSRAKCHNAQRSALSIFNALASAFPPDQRENRLIEYQLLYMSSPDYITVKEYIDYCRSDMYAGRLPRIC
ncbi:hypothetical protein LY78DRAFT_78516 [Colletotrichum sublineola]|nr:hypothetical protein LY78DRAFT_78516 [Colletotrichum sublineola]